MLAKLQTPMRTASVAPFDRTAKIDAVLTLMFRHFGVSKLDQVSPRHERSLVKARHWGMLLMNKCYGWKLAEIGRAYGGRDHTTVRIAILKTEGLLDNDSAAKTRFTALLAELRLITGTPEQKPGAALPRPPSADWTREQREIFNRRWAPVGDRAQFVYVHISDRRFHVRVLKAEVCAWRPAESTGEWRGAYETRLAAFEAAQAATEMVASHAS
jgi:hypothetical protein